MIIFNYRRLIALILVLVFAFSIAAFATEFVGSAKSNVYHYPSCVWAKRISPKNLMQFNSAKDAQQKGYRPCKVCKPPAQDFLQGRRSRVVDGNNIVVDLQGRCIRVVDGDTIVVDLGERREKVRLIGVDTPETVHPAKPVEYFAKEASDFTRRMVEGKEVCLKFDWQQRDKYKRLLAYVYLLDGTFVNAEIIKQGYGFAYTRYPFKYMDKFRGHQMEAKEKRKGLWGK